MNHYTCPTACVERNHPGREHATYDMSDEDAQMTPEQAAQLIASESWPGERLENRRAWAPRLIAEPDMAEAEVAHALARIEQRRVNVLAAAAMLAVAADPADTGR